MKTITKHLHNHNLIIYDLTVEEIAEIHTRLKGLTYESKLVDV